MKVKEVLEATEGELIKGDIDSEIGEFCKDTRIIKKGDTYIGIKGENFDGNTLWKEAIKKGAKTVILQDNHFTKENTDEYIDTNIILVKDTIKALAQIATYKRDLYGNDFPLVGVTGSVGKTSTKDIIANVVSQKYKKARRIAPSHFYHYFSTERFAISIALVTILPQSLEETPAQLPPSFLTWS